MDAQVLKSHTRSSDSEGGKKLSRLRFELRTFCVCKYSVKLHVDRSANQLRHRPQFALPLQL